MDQGTPRSGRSTHRVKNNLPDGGRPAPACRPGGSGPPRGRGAALDEAGPPRRPSIAVVHETLSHRRPRRSSTFDDIADRVAMMARRGVRPPKVRVIPKITGSFRAKAVRGWSRTPVAMVLTELLQNALAGTAFSGPQVSREQGLIEVRSVGALRPDRLTVDGSADTGVACPRDSSWTRPTKPSALQIVPHPGGRGARRAAADHAESGAGGTEAVVDIPRRLRARAGGGYLIAGFKTNRRLHVRPGARSLIVRRLTARRSSSLIPPPDGPASWPDSIAPAAGIPP